MKHILLFLLALILSMTVATAESITLGDGTWKIGEDIPAGYYSITRVSWGTMVMCDVVDNKWQADLASSTVVRWLDTKSECVLRDDMYICIDLGKYRFTPITMNAAQKASETYSHLLDAKQNALWNNYEDKEAHEVPLKAGTYTVGIDIPAGNWCIRYFDTFTKTVTLAQNGINTRFRIYSPAGNSYMPDMLTHSFLKLKSGDMLKIEADKGDNGLFFIPLADYDIN